MYGTSSHVITPSCVILASGVARQKRQSKLGLWNSLCTTEPILLEVIKWVSKVHYAHIQIDDEVTSNIVYWALKSRTGSVDAYPIPCNPQFQLQQTNHSQDLWHQVDLLRYRVNHSIFYTNHARDLDENRRAFPPRSKKWQRKPWKYTDPAHEKGIRDWTMNQNTNEKARTDEIGTNDPETTWTTTLNTGLVSEIGVDATTPSWKPGELVPLFCNQNAPEHLKHNEHRQQRRQPPHAQHPSEEVAENMDKTDQDRTELENKHKPDAEQTTTTKEGTPDVAEEDVMDILMTSEGDNSMDTAPDTDSQTEEKNKEKSTRGRKCKQWAPGSYAALHKGKDPNKSKKPKRQNNQDEDNSSRTRIILHLENEREKNRQKIRDLDPNRWEWHQDWHRRTTERDRKPQKWPSAIQGTGRTAPNRSTRPQTENKNIGKREHQTETGKQKPQSQGQRSKPGCTRSHKPENIEGAGCPREERGTGEATRQAGKTRGPNSQPHPAGATQTAHNPPRGLQLPRYPWAPNDLDEPRSIQHTGTHSGRRKGMGTRKPGHPDWVHSRVPMRNKRPEERHNKTTG